MLKVTERLTQLISALPPQAEFFITKRSDTELEIIITWVDLAFHLQQRRFEVNSSNSVRLYKEISAYIQEAKDNSFER